MRIRSRLALLVSASLIAATVGIVGSPVAEAATHQVVVTAECSWSSPAGPLPPGPGGQPSLNEPATTQRVITLTVPDRVRPGERFTAEVTVDMVGATPDWTVPQGVNIDSLRDITVWAVLGADPPGFMGAETPPMEVRAGQPHVVGTATMSITAPSTPGGTIDFYLLHASREVQGATSPGPGWQDCYLADGYVLIGSVPVEELFCLGHRVTIAGTSGDDVIYGTNGRDVIHGVGGNNRIYGLGGDDIICGGAGNDVIYAGTGNNRIDGGGGTNLLIGGPGRDVCTNGLRIRC